MPFLLDTSTYLRILLDRRFAHGAEPALRRMAPTLYLSSVVRAEITQGARGAAGRVLADRLVGTLEQVGRTISPTHEDWRRAGAWQSELWDRHPGLRNKRLLHDLLIAISAKKIGAHLVTDNESDFAIIDRWVSTRRLSTDALLNKS